MTRSALLLLMSLIFTGHADAGRVNTVGAPRSEALRNVEGYAIASCLAYQSQPYLQDQAGNWGSLIIQRGQEPLEIWSVILEAVKRSVAKAPMTVIKNDVNPEMVNLLPILYCSEIIDQPAVRTAIQKTVARLKPYYKQKNIPDGANTVGAPRSKALRNAEGYAIASCLVQPQPYFKYQGYLKDIGYLKDQGDGWTSVIMQREKAPVEIWAALQDAVKREVAKGDMVIILPETGSEKVKLLPVVYCGEIIDKPAVSAAIQMIVAKLKTYYKQGNIPR